MWVPWVAALLQLKGQAGVLAPNCQNQISNRSQKFRIVNKICYLNIIIIKNVKAVSSKQNTYDLCGNGCSLESIYLKKSNIR